MTLASDMVVDWLDTVRGERIITIEAYACFMGSQIKAWVHGQDTIGGGLGVSTAAIVQAWDCSYS